MTAPVAWPRPRAPRAAVSGRATTCCTTGTAVHCVRTRGRVTAGETVLITGAYRRRGPQAVQLARHDGARVLAVTSSEEKASTLQAAGAHEVIVSKDLRFASEVRRRTGGEGVQVAIEIVGSLTLAETLKALAPGGRLVVVGNLKTASVEVNPGLVIVKELEILGAYATTSRSWRRRSGWWPAARSNRGSQKCCSRPRAPTTGLEKRGVAAPGPLPAH